MLVVLCNQGANSGVFKPANDGQVEAAERWTSSLPGLCGTASRLGGRVGIQLDGHSSQSGLRNDMIGCASPRSIQAIELSLPSRNDSVRAIVLLNLL